MTKYLLIGLAFLALVGAALYFRGNAIASTARATAAEQRARDLGADLAMSEQVRAIEHGQAEHFNAIAAQYEKDKNDAQATASQLAADLRAQRIRLRPVWNCPASGVPSIAASAGKPDAGADDRAESTARILRAADDADSQIRALQDVLKAEREPATAASGTQGKTK